MLWIRPLQCLGRLILPAFGGAMALTTLAPWSAASAQVVPPGQSYAGQSQYAWSADWWTVFLEASATNNPLNSSSSGASLQRVNSGNPAVFFLTGSGDGKPLQRSVRIRSNQAVFFPIVNYAETDPFVADECGFATSVISTMTIQSIYARLDGADLLPNLLGQRQSCSTQTDTSGEFKLRIRTGDLYASFGYPPGPYQAATNGYWLMLKPLPVGTHTLSFGGLFDLPDLGLTNLVQDNTYQIQVDEVPGPLPLLGLGAACGIGRRLRRRVRPDA